MTTVTEQVSNPETLTIELDEILRLIPHRFPMLLVEKIVDVVPGESAVGIKNVSINEWYFQGHFPKKPFHHEPAGQGEPRQGSKVAPHLTVETAKMACAGRHRRGIA